MLPSCRKKGLKSAAPVLAVVLVSLMFSAGCSDNDSAPLLLPGRDNGPNSVYTGFTYALHGNGYVNVISEATGTVVKSIDSDVDGNGVPGDVSTGGTLGSMTPDGKKLYVSNAGANMTTVTVIDLTTNAKIKDIETGTTGGDSRPKHAVVSPDGKWVGVNHWRKEPNGKLRVSFINTSDDTVYQNIDLTLTRPALTGNQSMHNAWSWDSKYFFTSSYQDDKVYIFQSPSTAGGQFQLAQVFDLYIGSAATDNNDPHYFAPSNDGKQMWIVTEGPSGSTYDPATPLSAPRMYIVNLDPLQLYVPLFGQLQAGEVIEGHHGNFSLDGKYFYFCNRGPGSNLTGVTVDVFDTTTWQLAKHVVTSAGGDGHAYLSPDGKWVAVTKYGTNVLTFLDTANDWAIIDVTVGSGIHVGHVTFTPDSKKAFCMNRVDGAVYEIDLSGATPVVSKTIALVKPDLTTAAGSGAGQVLNTYSNIFEVQGNLFKK